MLEKEEKLKKVNFKKIIRRKKKEGVKDE